MYEGRVVLVCLGGKYIDRIRITEVLLRSGQECKIRGRSLDRAPGRTDEFVSGYGGWRRLFPDPMTKEPVFSQRTPALQIFETSHS